MMKFNEKLINKTWHWVVVDRHNGKLNFILGAKMLDEEEHISSTYLHSIYLEYFTKRTGYMLLTECPMCREGVIIPRRSASGYFVGCSTFPECTFKSKFAGTPTL